jgi:hypothetical protein
MFSNPSLTQGWPTSPIPDNGCGQAEVLQADGKNTFSKDEKKEKWSNKFLGWIFI